jgi:glycine/D-amino acid oxidase-like deaminating enzyme/nitrite reductase/ring-hydroxylating ferredoxin subunit
MSQRTTAHLTCMLDDRYADLIKLRGAADAWLAAKSHCLAIDRIEQVQQTESIDCDFKRVDGYLFLAPEHGGGELERELAAVRELGVPEVGPVDRAPVHGFETGPCLHFARQGRMHAGKYLAGLAQAIQRHGGLLYARARVVAVAGGQDAHLVTDTGHRLSARWIVVATNVPINDRVTIHTKQAPYRTYVVASRVPKGALSDALFWDTGDPYHYVRVQPESEIDWVIVGGEDHKTGQAHDGIDRFTRLVDWARARLPFGEPERFWSGQIMETIDYLCFAGPNPGGPENVLIATGDSGIGMTHGTIAAHIIADAIQGHGNPWASLYDPSRITFRAGWEYLKQNLNAAAQYREYATPGETRSADSLQPGEGAVIRRGARKLAVYRDERGLLHEMSAVCPHLGCIVAWNPMARSWDCPCHGSQFAGDGTVINGPAVSSLEPAEERRRRAG